MKRLREWQSRFAACLAERRTRAFAWGSQDCALFAADCVDACTGVDPAADLRGTYSTAAAAARVMEAHGGLAALATARLGEEISPRVARVGDVGLLLNGGRECLGVCIGSMWQAPGEQGLCALPASQVLRAWRIETGA
jgi:hypothetical protein